MRSAGGGQEREVILFFGVMMPGVGDDDKATGDAGRDSVAVSSGVEDLEVNSSSSNSSL
jgi:hypothetical protein